MFGDVLDILKFIAVIGAVLLLLVVVYRFAKKRISKYPETQGPASPLSFVVILAVASSVAIWMSRYNFDHMNLENGESYPVRTNRLTGKSQVLYRGVWKPAEDVRNLPSLLQELSQQDLDKLTGRGDLVSDWFYLDLYNGSDFTLKEITVQLLVRDSHQEEVLRQPHRFSLDAPSKRSTSFEEIVNISVGPQQSWSWKIIAAKGIRN